VTVLLTLARWQHRSFATCTPSPTKRHAVYLDVFSTVLLARDVQAKLALIVAQIYPSVHLCPRQLESMELSVAANFAARRLSAFFPKLVQGTHVWYTVKPR